MVTALAANTYFNSSLAELVSTMVHSHVFMMSATREWAGKPYKEYFDHLLWTESLLAIGLYRQGDLRRGDKAHASGKDTEEDEDEDEEEEDDVDETFRAKEKLNYVYTTPPAKSTTITETDRIICFGMSPYAIEEEKIRLAKEKEEAH